MAGDPSLDQFAVSPSVNTLPALKAPTPDDNASRQLVAMGGAIQGAGRDAAAIQLDAVQSANRTRVDEAVNALRERQLDLTYGREGDDKTVGYTTLRGRDAIYRPDGQSLPDEYTGALSATADDISRGLGNNAQREAFNRASRELSTSFRADISRHEDGEFRTYALSVSEGVIQTGQRTMALSAGNPERSAEAALSIRAQVAQTAHLTGRSAEWVQAQQIAMLSPGHTGAIAALLEAHDPSAAERYLGMHRDEMSADDLLRVDTQIGQEQDLQIATEVATEYSGRLTGEATPSAGGSAPAPARPRSGATGRQRGDYASPTAAIVGLGQEWVDQGFIVGENLHVGNRHFTQGVHKTGAAHGERMIDVNDRNMPPGSAQVEARNPQARARFDRMALDAQARGYRVLWNERIYEPYGNGPGRAIGGNDTDSHRHRNHMHVEAGRGAPARPGGQPQQQAQTGGSSSVSDIIRDMRADPRLTNNPRRLQEAERQVQSMAGLVEHDQRRGQEDAVDNAMRWLADNHGAYERMPVRLRNAVPGRMLDSLMSFSHQVQERERGPGISERQSVEMYGRVREQIANGAITRPEQLTQFAPGLTPGDYRALVNDVTGRSNGRSDTVDSLRTVDTALGDARTELLQAGVDPRQNIDAYGAIRTDLIGRLGEAERLAGHPLSREEARTITLDVVARHGVRSLMGGAFGTVDDVARGAQGLTEHHVPYRSIPQEMRLRIAASLQRRTGRRVSQREVEQEYMILAGASQQAREQ